MDEINRALLFAEYTLHDTLLYRDMRKSQPGEEIHVQVAYYDSNTMGCCLHAEVNPFTIE